MGRAGHDMVLSIQQFHQVRDMGIPDGDDKSNLYHLLQESSQKVVNNGP